MVATRAPSEAAILSLEAVAARGWPAPTVRELDGWWLRAADGTFTARANSAVPVTPRAVETVTAQLAADPGVPPVVETIRRWYEQQGLPPRLALPVPLMDGLRARLAAHGWAGRGPTMLMAAGAAAVLAACRERDDLPPLQVADHLDDAWLRGYERGHEVTDPCRRAILEGGGARLATLHHDEEVAAGGGTVVEGL
jgi:hypothetical protein